MPPSSKLNNQNTVKPVWRYSPVNIATIPTSLIYAVSFQSAKRGDLRSIDAAGSGYIIGYASIADEIRRDAGTVFSLYFALEFKSFCVAKKSEEIKKAKSKNDEANSVDLRAKENYFT